MEEVDHWAPFHWAISSVQRGLGAEGGQVRSILCPAYALPSWEVGASMWLDSQELVGRESWPGQE